MPVKAVRRGDKWRVVEASTGKLAKNAAGTPVSKGFSTKAAADKQARAINASLNKRKSSSKK